MKKPSLEEVREYFKDANIVRNKYCSAKFKPNLEFLNTDFEGHISTTIEESVCESYTLWSGEYGYAEIVEYKNKPMKKVIRLDQPKEESKKPIEITHFIHPDEGWINDEYLEDDDVEDIQKIVYLGKCAQDGDIFAVYYSGDIISIQKGYLNDGVY